MKNRNILENLERIKELSGIKIENLELNNELQMPEKDGWY